MRTAHLQSRTGVRIAQQLIRKNSILKLSCAAIRFLVSDILSLLWRKTEHSKRIIEVLAPIWRLSLAVQWLHQGTIKSPKMESERPAYSSMFPGGDYGLPGGEFESPWFKIVS